MKGIAHQRPHEAVYCKATEILITASGGGSNGYRLNGFEVALQQFADETGLASTAATFRRVPASGTPSNVDR